MAKFVEVKITFDMETLTIPRMSHPTDLRLTQAILNEALHMVSMRRVKNELGDLQVKSQESKIIQFQGSVPPLKS